MVDPIQQLRAFVRQGAETAKLLDVDFIPVYRCGVLDVPMPEIVPDDAPAPVPAPVASTPSLAAGPAAKPKAVEPPPRQPVRPPPSVAPSRPLCPVGCSRASLGTCVCGAGRWRVCRHHFVVNGTQTPLRGCRVRGDPRLFTLTASPSIFAHRF